MGNTAPARRVGPRARTWGEIPVAKAAPRAPEMCADRELALRALRERMLEVDGPSVVGAWGQREIYAYPTYKTELPHPEDLVVGWESASPFVVAVYRASNPGARTYPAFSARSRAAGNKHAVSAKLPAAVLPHVRTSSASGDKIVATAMVLPHKVRDSLSADLVRFVVGGVSLSARRAGGAGGITVQSSLPPEPMRVCAACRSWFSVESSWWCLLCGARANRCAECSDTRRCAARCQAGPRAASPGAPKTKRGGARLV